MEGDNGETLSKAFIEWYQLVAELHASEIPMKTLAIARQSGLIQQADPVRVQFWRT